MKADEFCRWLQGFCELHGEPPTAEQWESIKAHLQLLYVKVTPSTGRHNPWHGLGDGDKIC